jgi:hypothetical protein
MSNQKRRNWRIIYLRRYMKMERCYNKKIETQIYNLKLSNFCTVGLNKF